MPSAQLPTPAAHPQPVLPSAGGWLPERGNGRAAQLALWLAVLALKLLAIIHFRADSDETQHAHVVWAWTTGRLQYRDVFDNHMPLFQMACAPYFHLLGERAHIMEPLRLAMLPLYLVCLWAVFRLAEILFSRKAAPWAALFAALCPWFFYTSTEFRTDDLWAAFWLLSLVVAVSGRFTVKRALAFGLMLGLVFAVSMKTVVLAMALGISTLIALGLNRWNRGPAFSLGGHAARILAIVAAAMLAPAALVLFFTAKGAFWIMYYCVVQHNVVPGLKRWGHFSLHQWYFPVSAPLLIAYGALIYRQARDPALALRRVIILLTPCFFFFLLLSYWPDITREDDLPYAPLLPLTLTPLFLWAGELWKKPGLNRVFWSRILPAMAVMELIWTWRTNNLRQDRLRVTTHSIQDILQLTKPDDYVMDAKGDYVFRPRAFYWVLEPLTKARLRRGDIHDDLPARLKSTRTKICYMYCGRPSSPEAAFIVSNYLPFDREALDVGTAGKEIGPPDAGGAFDFDVSIAVTYAVVSQSGRTAGELDGKPYTGPLFLAPGHHHFRRTAGSGRAAIILGTVIEQGYSPLFNALDQVKARLMPPVGRGLPAA